MQKPSAASERSTILAAVEAPPSWAERSQYHEIAAASLAGRTPTVEEGLRCLTAPDDELLLLLDAALQLRLRYFGRDVTIHVLRNAKSGICPEDCGFCSQSTRFKSAVPRYPMQSVDEIVRGAYRLEGFTADDVDRAGAIMRRYGDLQIGLADASIVVLAERHATTAVLTLDLRRFQALRVGGRKRFRIVPAEA